MIYNELKKIVGKDYAISKRLYICDFFTCDVEKMKTIEISLVKNIFGKYIVTKWSDYEYGKHVIQKQFSDKNLAADYAWELLEVNK